MAHTFGMRNDARIMTSFFIGGNASIQLNVFMRSSSSSEGKSLYKSRAGGRGQSQQGREAWPECEQENQSYTRQRQQTHPLHGAGLPTRCAYACSEGE